MAVRNLLSKAVSALGLCRPLARRIVLPAVMAGAFTVLGCGGQTNVEPVQPAKSTPIQELEPLKKQ